MFYSSNENKMGQYTNYYHFVVGNISISLPLLNNSFFFSNGYISSSFFLWELNWKIVVVLLTNFVKEADSIKLDKSILSCYNSIQM